MSVRVHKPTREEVPQALVDHIATSIRAKILSGEFGIGHQLRQAALADEFKVSRTPVREAIRQLQTGGLIEVVPNRGAVVRVPAPWDVREAYEVRATLEALAAERAVSRISDEQIEALRTANRKMYEAGEERAQRGSAALPTLNDFNDAFHTTIHLASANLRLANLIAQINESFPRNVSALVLADNARQRRGDVRGA